jgi:hypothetical protein
VGWFARELAVGESGQLDSGWRWADPRRFVLGWDRSLAGGLGRGVGAAVVEKNRGRTPWLPIILE